MSRTTKLIACALAASLAAPAGYANDSVAETAAGGLVLRQSRDIDMVSEDLFVSAREIRVRYVFRNRTRRPVGTIVAFPMPDRDLAREEEGDYAWPAEFRTRVDGREVAMRVEHKVLAHGVDRTALLAELGIPILGRRADGAVDQGLDQLPRAAQDRLAGAGLVEISTAPGSDRRYLTRRWTVKETWYWRQVFPAGRDIVVEHRYRPGAGGTVATALASVQSRESDYGRAMIARYCIDRPVIDALERYAAQAGNDYPSISETWLSYVLVTGANWRAPIGEFRLVVDKGEARNLVSFCGEGVRRISDTRFEMRRRHWRPTRNLDVLILHTPPPG